MTSHYVSIIGSGNVASHLAPALDNAGFVIKEVYSRNARHAAALTEKLYQAEVKATLDFSTSDSSIFVIAVVDDAIQEIAREIILPDDAILLHTSGSQPLNILGFSATARLGVLYPLQTFTQGRKIDFSTVPVFIESSDDETGALLGEMARAVSKNVHHIGSNERKALHIAAVLASNFTNYMLALSEDVMEVQKLDFKWLVPLITETISKSLALGPERAQTGPARRGDFRILDQHMEFLKAEDESTAEIYRLISQHIVDRYDNS